MHVSHITLQNFRNYRSERFDFSPGLNIVSGRNAQGKTNLLEAVYYLAAATSFRARRDAELVRWNEQRAAIEAEVQLSDRTAVLRAEFSTTSRRSLYLNGVRERTAADFAGRLTAVLFTPSDLSLVDDGAAARRRFMDACFGQLRPRYAAALSAYNRLHDQKTRILRDHQKNPSMLSTLDTFNARLAIEGATIIAYRARFCAALAETAANLHGEISGGAEHMTLHYKTVSTITDPFAPLSQLQEQILRHMDTRRAAELARQQALSGPHKDDIDIEINHMSARAFASQGQKRTAALSLKLAERELLRGRSGEQPVLLLDDVLSELDDHRRAWILSHGGGGQVIISLCDSNQLQNLDAKIISIDRQNFE